MEKLDKIKKYAQFHIDNLTEEINEYIYDYHFEDKDLIDSLDVEIEYWKDILKIINNNDDDLFINLPF